jgi:hypothetical protein
MAAQTKHNTQIYLKNNYSKYRLRSVAQVVRIPLLPQQAKGPSSNLGPVLSINIYK